MCRACTGLGNPAAGLTTVLCNLMCSMFAFRLLQAWRRCPAALLAGALRCWRRRASCWFRPWRRRGTGLRWSGPGATSTFVLSYTGPLFIQLFRKGCLDQLQLRKGATVDAEVRLFLDTQAKMRPVAGAGISHAGGRAERRGRSALHGRACGGLRRARVAFAVLVATKAQESCSAAPPPKCCCTQRTRQCRGSAELWRSSFAAPRPHAHAAALLTS